MQAHTVAVRAITEVGAETIAVDLETPPDFDPMPGQFVKLSAFVDGEHVVRFYTMSSPDADETFEITIGIDPDGAFGPWIADAVGETVALEGPYGRAFYDGESRSVVLASGPGIGAAVGIAERALADGNDATVVVYGADPPHMDRLDALAAHGVAVDITDELSSIASHLGGDGQVFVYGFQDFVSDALATIEAAGGDPAAAKVENYG